MSVTFWQWEGEKKFHVLEVNFLEKILADQKSPPPLKR